MELLIAQHNYTNPYLASCDCVAARGPGTFKSGRVNDDRIVVVYDGVSVSCDALRKASGERSAEGSKKIVQSKLFKRTKNVREDNVHTGVCLKKAHG